MFIARGPNGKNFANWLTEELERYTQWRLRSDARWEFELEEGLTRMLALVRKQGKFDVIVQQGSGYFAEGIYSYSGEYVYLTLYGGQVTGTKNTTGKLNVFYEDGMLTVQNKTGGPLNVTVLL